MYPWKKLTVSLITLMQHILSKSTHGLAVAKTSAARQRAIQNNRPTMRYDNRDESAHTIISSNDHQELTLKPRFLGPTEAVISLYTKWEFGSLSLKQHVHEWISRPEWTTAIFGLPGSGDNMFNIIVQIIPKAEQGPLTQALLMECSQWGPLATADEDPLFCWRSAFSQPDWHEFKRALGKLRLEPFMSRDAANLVLDSTFTLVGQRLLKECYFRLYFGTHSESVESTLGSFTGSPAQYLAQCSDQDLQETISNDLRAGRGSLSGLGSARGSEGSGWTKIDESYKGHLKRIMQI